MKSDLTQSVDCQQKLKLISLSSEVSVAVPLNLMLNFYFKMELLMNLESQKLKQLSELFSAATIRKIADGKLDVIPRFAYLYRSILKESFIDLTLEQLFENSFHILSRNYRNEYTYKSLLLNKKLIGTHSVNTSSMLSELRVGSAKADFVMLNGVSTCFEIKTERDSLERLPNQLAEYNGYFDQTYIVLSEQDVGRYQSKIPSTVGIISLTSRNQFSEIRPSLKGCEGYTSKMAINLLRAIELKKIVSIYDQKVENIPNTELVKYCENALNLVNANEIKKLVLLQLKKRGMKNNNFMMNLPKSLRAAGIEYKLSIDQRTKLMINLGKVISQMDYACITPFSELSSSS